MKRKTVAFRVAQAGSLVFAVTALTVITVHAQLGCRDAVDVEAEAEGRQSPEGDRSVESSLEEPPQEVPPPAIDGTAAPDEPEVASKEPETAAPEAPPTAVPQATVPRSKKPGRASPAPIPPAPNAKPTFLPSTKSGIVPTFDEPVPQKAQK